MQQNNAKGVKRDHNRVARSRNAHTARQDHHTGQPGQNDAQRASQGNDLNSPIECALFELSKHLASKTFTLQKASAIALRHAKKLTSSEHGHVGVIGPEDWKPPSHPPQDLKANGHRTPSRQQSTATLTRHSPLWKHCLHTRKGFFTNNPHRHESSRAMTEKGMPLRNLLSVPVRFNGELVGQITLANSTRKYTRQDMAAMARLADIFALATNQIRMQHAVQRSESVRLDIIDHLHAIYWEYDMHKDIFTFISRQSQGILGYSPSHWLRPGGMGIWSSMVHKEDRTAAMHSRMKSQDTEHAYRMLTAGGNTVWIHEIVHPERDEGEKGILTGLMLDITPHKEAQKELKGQQKLLQKAVRQKTIELEKISLSFKNVFELAQDMLCLASMNRLIKVNPAFTAALGYSEKELLKRSLKDLVHPDDMTFTMSLINRKMKKGSKVFRFVNRVITRSGECRHLEWVSTPLIDGTLLFASARDITERIEAEQALRESEERFRTMADLLPEIVFETDTEGIFTYVNRFALDRTGYDQRDIAMRLSFTSLLVPEDRNRGDKSFRRLMRGDHVGGIEYTMLKKDGSTFPVVIRGKPMERNGMAAGIRGVVMDMTHLKKKENALLKSLKEKEVLLQEVHHRVKNNMSIISSLLSLQANASGDEHITQALKESRDRIHSLALVHEMLYRSKDFSSIAFGDYARSICEALASSYDTGVDMCINCGRITLPLETLIPIGLILNEAFTNSVKYAFDNGHAKKIGITLKQSGKTMVLVIQDNGKGMPAEVINGKGRNLGLSLISQLSQQLMGDLDISNQSGTVLRITFPAPQIH